MTSTSEAGENDTMYGGGDDDVPHGTKSPSVDEENEEKSSGTILIPKSAMGGKKFAVGDEIVFTITADHGDEMSAKYATDGKGEHDRSEADDNAEIDGMAEKGSMPEMAEY